MLELIVLLTINPDVSKLLYLYNHNGCGGITTEKIRMIKELRRKASLAGVSVSLREAKELIETLIELSIAEIADDLPLADGRSLDDRLETVLVFPDDPVRGVKVKVQSDFLAGFALDECEHGIGRLDIKVMGRSEVYTEFMSDS